MPLAVALLILWPLAELLVIVLLAEWVGLIPTLVALVVSCLAGRRIVRAEGRALARRVAAALAAGRAPGPEALDAALVMLGGLLLLIPGFLGDLAGVALLTRPLRALCRRSLERRRNSAWVRRAAGIAGGGRFARPGRAYDAEATASEFEPPRLRP